MRARPSRLSLIAAGFVAAGLVALARAAQLQLAQGGKWRARANSQQTERVALAARRGTLYDRNGVALGLSQETYGIGLAPHEVADPAAAQWLLALAMRRTVTETADAVRSPRPWLEWPGPYPWAEVARLARVRGVYLLPRFQRIYPRPALARRVVGGVDDSDRGASALERSLDTLLAGRAGWAVMLRDSRGRRFRSPSRPGSDAVAGADVYLSLDAELQDIAERTLEEAVTGFHAVAGDVLILQPASGQVLALASVRRDPEEGTGAVSDVFEPGSTAKIFTAAALLATGRASAEDSVFAEHGTLRLPGRTITDEHPAGWLTLADVIRLSSNVGIAKLAERLEPVEQFEMLRAFGFGTPTGVDFPAEAAGRLRPPRSWTRTSGASLAIGYELSVTALQVAAAYGAIANEGVLLEPTLVREVRGPDGGLLYRHVPRPVRRVVTPAVARQLIRMLRGVVAEGTGRRAELGGYTLAGKSGTARHTVAGRYVEGHYTASFVGLFPAEHPQLVILVKLDDPAGQIFGGQLAAPITREIVEASLATWRVPLDRGPLSRAGERSRPGGSTSLAGELARDKARRGPRETGPAVVVEWPLKTPPPAAGSGLSVPPGNQPPRPTPHAPRTALGASAVPSVAGLTLREAARILHGTGFTVRLRGWGRVRESVPAAGTEAPRGSVVVIVAASNAL